MEQLGLSETQLKWEESTKLDVAPTTLNLLFNGQIAGLCVPDFLTPGECKDLRDRVESLDFMDYENVQPRIRRFGITVFEYDRIGKSDYFAAVTRVNESVARITHNIYPRERVIEWFAGLSSAEAVGIAHEEHYGSYFAGLLRRIEEGTLVHVDFAPLEHPGWSVAQITEQLALNVYLDVPSSDSGVLRVWQRQWTAEADAFKIPNSYGYQHEVIDNVPYADIIPQVGMLVAINSRHFHQVLQANGTRLAMSVAAGRMPDGRIVLWS